MSASTDSLRIGFIGAGQLATALAWSLARSGYRVVGAASRSRAPAEKLSSGIADARAFDDAQVLADASDLIVIAVPDDSIAPVARSVTWRQNHYVVHCSAATELSALSAAAEQAASTGGFHPLQTFTNTEAAMQTLPGCAAAIEAADQSLLDLLWGMASALGCKPFRLPAGARPLYHASGSFAGSFLVRLINDALDLWVAFGVDREQAFQALLPLTKGTVAALEANGPVKSLAGPIARADVGTVERHIAALRERAPELVPAYLDLARRSVAISAAKGGASTEKLEALKALLER
jgi:predicted short-subunit dehydrogenase-like oxidoreductase (DUF2520 family)